MSTVRCAGSVDGARPAAVMVICLRVHAVVPGVHQTALRRRHIGHSRDRWKPDRSVALLVALFDRLV